MIEILFVVGFFILIWFIGIVLVGAPYVPSKQVHISAGLDLLNLKKGQKLVEFGSGDGRVLRFASERGIEAVGYEINPILFAVSWVLCRRYPNIKVRMKSYWRADLSDADGVFVFSAGPYMERLNKKLSEHGKNIKMASVGFRIKGKKPAKTKDGVFLYKYSKI